MAREYAASTLAKRPENALRGIRSSRTSAAAPARTRGARRVGQKPRTDSPMGTRKSVQRSVTTPEKPVPSVPVRDLGALVQEFGDLLRREFAANIERDARGFKRDALCLLRAALSPGPGRPRSEAVTLAIELRAQGKPWQAIYSQCIPSALVDDARQLAQSRLRSAVRSRHNAGRRRKPPVDSYANKT
jgi:hypothetical protein